MMSVTAAYQGTGAYMLPAQTITASAPRWLWVAVAAVVLLVVLRS